MTDDELERTLRSAFAARARAAAADDALPPPPRFATSPTPNRHRRLRVVAPLAAAAAVVAVGVAVTSLHEPSRHAALVGRSAATSAPAPSAGSGRLVHIELANAEGATYGVGMPVIAYFSRQITDAAALTAATTIAVNGVPAHGAWYFERSTRAAYPLEGHLRLARFWPAHSKIRVALATKGVTAGTGLAFDDTASVDFTTGAAMIARIDDRRHTLRLTEDDKPVGVYPVSLGRATTPTSRGTKVIMDKRPSVCLHGAAGAFYECGVKYAQRLTADGEYLVAAPWNSYNIAHGIDSSNGCTDLTSAAAQRLYSTLRVGDVVEFPDAGGPDMKLGDGLGDWNVPWSDWLTGGLVPTR